MILGMSVGAFTVLHVVITLVAIGSGLIVVGGMFASHRLPITTAIFLFTTAQHLVGAWRWIYVITAVVSLYLNVFVLVVQSFVKVSAWKIPVVGVLARRVELRSRSLSRRTRTTPRFWWCRTRQQSTNFSNA